MKNKINDENFYITIKDKKEFVTYCSDIYKLNEFDFLSMIRMSYIEGRNKKVGKKLILVYLDSTKERKELSIERLNKMGIKEYGTPTITKRNRIV